MRTIRTFFSGGELFGYGALAAGYKHIDGYELRPDIAAVAQANGFDVRCADVRMIDYEGLAPVDHAHFSPSCKTASQANPNSGETAEDIEVADAVCRAIRAHTGRTVSLENVWMYRNFESFLRILEALKQSCFNYTFDHVNAADYGVPQTRKRLILRAVRGASVPSLHPTHRKHGDMFSAPWVGWYAAIADLIPTLPTSAPAPWQAQRLNLIAETVLVANRQSHDRNGNSYGFQMRPESEPAQTINTASAGWWRAYLVGGGNTNLTNPTSLPRNADEPAFTVRTGSGSPERALLIDGANGRKSERRPTFARGTDPAFTIGANKCVHRAVVTGHWVRMTIQALGRFQTVPDDYIGLTSEINGNGVPCLLAQRIMESFHA